MSFERIKPNDGRLVFWVYYIFQSRIPHAQGPERCSEKVFCVDENSNPLEITNLTQVLTYLLNLLVLFFDNTRSAWGNPRAGLHLP